SGIQYGIGQPFGTYTAPKRSGACVAARAAAGSIASRNGSATTAPAPRSTARLDSDLRVISTASLLLTAAPFIGSGRIARVVVLALLDLLRLLQELVGRIADIAHRHEQKSCSEHLRAGAASLRESHEPHAQRHHEDHGRRSDQDLCEQRCEFHV